MVLYKVVICDNFHFGDEDSCYTVAEYTTAGEAISHCQAIIDRYLDSAYKPGMTAAALWSSWSGFGEDPWISGPADFSAVGYTKARCAVLCGG